MSTSTLIFIIIMVVVVAGIGIVVTYAVVKNNRKKKKLAKEVKTTRKKVDFSKIVILVLFNELILGVRRYIANIDSSDQSRSNIQQINDKALKIIRRTKESPEYSYVVKQEDEGEVFKSIIHQLELTKASNWDAEAFFPINYITSNYKLIKEDDKLSDDVKEEIVKLEGKYRWN